ncbi:hypothetical protein ACW7BJ_16190 [Azospirillum argentinense]
MLNSPAPRESWLSYPYWIATDCGPQPVMCGKARGPFAVHRDRDGWCLTHLPTGVLIGLADNAEKEVASAMLRSSGIRTPETRKFWTPSAIAPSALPLGA